MKLVSTVIQPQNIMAIFENQIENLLKTIKILFVIILLGVNFTSTYSQN